MKNTQEKFYLSKTDVRRELNVSPALYQQLIASGILPKPFILTGGKRARHKPSDVETARRRREKQSIEAQESAFDRNTEKVINKRVKPVSRKHRAQYQAARS